MADLISSFQILVTADKATVQLQKLILLEARKLALHYFIKFKHSKQKLNKAPPSKD